MSGCNKTPSDSLGNCCSCRRKTCFCENGCHSSRTTQQFTETNQTLHTFSDGRAFLTSNGIVLRAKTHHQGQEDSRVMHDEALKFLETTRQRLIQPNRLQRFIIIMDQTPFNSADTQSRTLDVRGTKTVNVKKMKNSVGLVTC